VAGWRSNETVFEDHAIQWDRSDYDPYARTKKFCEHMIRELLPNVPITIFRPSIVMGDSRHERTTQFDMVRAFVFLARLWILPLRPTDRLDIVPADFVAESVVALHQKEKPTYDTYHLSSGEASQSCRQITDALIRAKGGRGPVYCPSLAGPFQGLVGRLADWRGTAMGRLASLLKVFLPYLLWNTVFDNKRVVHETGKTPARFTDYCFPLYEFAVENKFTFPYQEWPQPQGRAGR
jgi:nucleoside-diphosphate-sugar epimerase